MSAERIPPTDSSSTLLSKPLGLVTRLVVRYPWPTVTLALAIAFYALYLTATNLGFRSSRLDLLNPQSSYNKLWVEYIDEFGDADDVVIVVRGEHRDQVIPVMEEISSSLQQHQDLFHSILHQKVDISKFRSKGLHFLSIDQLNQIDTFLTKLKPVLDEGKWEHLGVNQMTAGLFLRLQHSRADQQASVRSEIKRLTRSLNLSLTGNQIYQSPWPEMSATVATLSDSVDQYLLTNEGKLGIVLLKLVKTDDSLARGSQGIDQLRALIKKLTLPPQVKVGLTGLPVMENDEMRASQRSSLKASLLSLFGVACLFIAGFGGLRHPLLTVTALVISLAWVMGYITVVVGHLNILSVSFGVILIGLGIDFGVHYVARYLHLRSTIDDSAVALEKTARSIGPGIITGGVTTSIAFFAAGLTQFTGIAELGIIAGGGILICVIGAIVLLPAMIQLSDRNRPLKEIPQAIEVDRPISMFMKFPNLTLSLSLLFSGLLAWGCFDLWYDHNLMNLQPDGVESIELEKMLLEESDESVWFALSVADSREELLAMKKQYEKLPSVERTEDIVSYLPKQSAEKISHISRIHNKLDHLPVLTPAIPLDPLENLAHTLQQASQVAAANQLEPVVLRELDSVRRYLLQTPRHDCRQRLIKFQQHMAGDLLSRLNTIKSMSSLEPPKLDDLPEGLVHRFVGSRGKHLLKVYSRSNIWDMDALEKFVKEVKSVDPRATGQPLQTYFASRQMQQSYIHAAYFALIGVLMVLVMDFNGLRFALLTLLPVGLGMVQLFGIMGWLNIPLNPANMIVLPLILGIGIDDGVHILHDYRTQTGRFRLSSSTATAVLITSLTTMIGFGSLMIADHRGLQSLGRVLTIGVTCCLFTSLIVLPALLMLISMNRPSADESGLEDGEEHDRDDQNQPPGSTEKSTDKDRQKQHLLPDMMISESINPSSVSPQEN